MESKENIFTRFINFIKRMFGKEGQKQIPAKTEVITRQEQKSNFLDELRLYKEEDPILLKLQHQYEKGEMDLNVMSDEQIHDLKLLYKRQISELEKELTDKETELRIMQYRIKSYSANM